MQFSIFNQCTFVYRPKKGASVPEQPIVFENYIEAIKFADRLKNELKQIGATAAYEKVKKSRRR